MKQTTLERFAEDLKGDAAERLDPRRLAEAKSRGARRRRTRAALVVVAATIAVGGVATLLVPGLDGGGSGRDTVARDVATRPTGLSKIQERVLRDVPGAERISPWQVAVPEPLGAVDGMEIPGDEFEVQGDTFPTGVPSYTGVTMYDRAAFPGWLYDGVLAIETAAGDEDGQPVGSTDMGIGVVNGTLELACVSFQGADCVPAVIRNEEVSGTTSGDSAPTTSSIRARAWRSSPATPGPRTRHPWPLPVCPTTRSPGSSSSTRPARSSRGRSTTRWHRVEHRVGERARGPGPGDHLRLPRFSGR